MRHICSDWGKNKNCKKKKQKQKRYASNHVNKHRWSSYLWMYSVHIRSIPSDFVRLQTIK